MASLTFKYAAMNAGKSASLLTDAHKYKERGMGTLLMKPYLDSRSEKISSRIGLEHEANIITPGMNVLEFYRFACSQKDIHAVFVDEAQFLSEENVLELCQIVDKYNTPVICYGLRTDFQGELFKGSKALLAAADKIEELKGVCHCGRKTTMTARIRPDGTPIIDGAQIECGGNESYVSLCRKHWCELVGVY